MDDIRTCKVRGCRHKVPAGKLGEHYANFHRNHPLGKIGLRGHRQMQRALDHHAKAFTDVGEHLVKPDGPEKYFPRNESYAEAFHTMLRQGAKSARPTTFLDR